MKLSLPGTQTKITLSIYFYPLVIQCPRVPCPPSPGARVSPTISDGCAGCTGGFGGTGGMGSKMEGMDEDGAHRRRLMTQTYGQARIESRPILWYQVPECPFQIYATCHSSHHSAKRRRLDIAASRFLEHGCPMV